MDEEKLLKNDIRFLKIGRKFPKWITPKTDGLGPSARINSTLNYYETLNILIVTGGSDRDKKFFYKDIFVYDVATFKWTKLFVFEDMPIERAEHATILMDKKFIIFGGKNSNFYIGSELYIVNFGKILT